MVKIRNIIFNEKPLQQAISQETTIWATQEGTVVLEHLNLFNKIINNVRTIDVYIDEDYKELIFSIHFRSLSIIS